MTERDLGLRIKEIRTKMGLSQFDFADLCDIPSGYIGSIETGRKNPTFIVLVKIANGCGLSLSEFFGDTVTETKDELIEKLISHAKPLDEKRLNDLIEVAQMLRKYSKP